MLLASDRQWASDVMANITAKMELVSERSQYKIPYTTINGTHDHRPDMKPGSDPADGISWCTVSGAA